MKKIIRLTLFFIITPLNLGISLLTLLNSQAYNPIANQKQPQVLAATDTAQIYAALPRDTSAISADIISGDARPLIIKNYLEKFNSPMAPYYQDLISEADKYEIDPWLIVAIAQCESNLCKRIPRGSFNCWGFARGETRFDSWQHAFLSVAKTLRERYFDYGLDTPEEIMVKYDPSSVETGGYWAKCVNQFIAELDAGGND